jgi:hypothetical protein
MTPDPLGPVEPTALRHLQATRRVASPASQVDAVLRTDGVRLVTEATARAVTATTGLRERGRFRRPAEPHVTVRVGDLASATLRASWDAERRATSTSTSGTFPGTSRWWRAEEEATGWPTATFDLLVEPRPSGCQLAVLSDRPVGADLSTNRGDRHVRDHLAREAFGRLLEALAELLDGAGPGSGGQHPEVDEPTA